MIDAMRSFALTIITALCSVAPVAPPAARATEFPGQREAAVAVQLLVDRAHSWWEADTDDKRLYRELTDAQLATNACADRPLDVWQARDLGDRAWARASSVTCEIWVSNAMAGALDHPYGWQQSVEMCAAIVHEVGHTRGLPHTRTGIMAEVVTVGRAPRFCVTWGRSNFAILLRSRGWSEKRIKKALGPRPKIRRR